MQGTLPSRSTRRQRRGLAFDSFTRADSTTSLGSTELGGKLWVPQSGFGGPVDALQMPGSSNPGMYASAPDSAALSITGDIDIRCLAMYPDWAVANAGLVSKYVGTGNQRSYQLYVSGGAKPRLVVNTDGTSVSDVDSLATASPGLTNGVASWLRATWRASDGRVQFFKAAGTIANPVTADWTQVGTDLTANIGSIFNSTAVVEIGSISAGTSKLATGKFYRAQIRNNILDDGTGIQFDADFTKPPAASTSFTEDSSNAATVTMNGVSWGISSNQAYQPVSRAQQIATIETGVANVLIRTTLPTAGPIGDTGIAFRVVDDFNYLLFITAGSGANQSFFSRVNGVFTSLATFSPGASGDVNEVMANGSYIQISRNGVIQYQGRNSSFLSATKHGIRIQGVTTARLDNFSVTAI